MIYISRPIRNPESGTIIRGHRNLLISSRAWMSNDGENLAEGVRWKNEEGLMRCVYWLPKVTPQETSRDVCPLFNCEHELGVRRRWGLDASDVFVVIFVFPILPQVVVNRDAWYPWHRFANLNSQIIHRYCVHILQKRQISDYLSPLHFLAAWTFQQNCSTWLWPSRKNVGPGNEEHMFPTY